MNKIKWFDAVRAFGLLLVLGYHLFYNILPSGFVGVDIFFTFSGFLLTALFMEEVRRKRRFDLVLFYKRRAGRIILPLFLSVVLTLPFALLVSPDFTVGIAKQVASALSFSSNWYNITVGTSYEAQLLPQLYVHTWSLAILMQFYIVWGAICASLAAFSNVANRKDKRHTKKRYVFLRNLVIAVSGVIAVCSFVYMTLRHSAGHELNTIYFDTLARSFPFFIGAIAAAVWGMNPGQDKYIKRRFLSKHPRHLVIAFISIITVSVAVIVLIISQRDFTDSFIYRYGFILTSLLTVVLIYCAHGLHLLTPSKMKEPKAVTIVAALSYDMYLYHWPLYVVFSALVVNNTLASFVTLAVAVAFSSLMVYGVKKGKELLKSLGGSTSRRIATAGVCVVLACALFSGGVVIRRAPAITSIEASFTAGTVAGDISDILYLKSGVDAVAVPPVVYAAQSTRLQPNLLPDPIAITEPSPSPEQAPSELPPETTEPEPTEPTNPPQQTPPPTQPSPTQDYSVVSDDPDAEPAAIPSGVTVIGDSVPLGARSAMMNSISGCHVDAAVNRTVNQGLSLLQNLQNRNTLREYVVIAIGTNADYNDSGRFTRIIEALNPGHKLIFVTPFDGRANTNGRLTGETAAWMRGLPSQYDYITIADWNSIIADQVELLAGDKVHLSGVDSINLYAGVVAGAVAAAANKPSKSNEV